MKMDRKGLLALPSELLEHICSYLALFDIARLEQVCKATKTSLQEETRVWRRETERLQRCFRCPLARTMLKYMKEKQISDYRYFKIMIGIMAHTKVVVADLEKMALEYKSAGEQEMDNYRNTNPSEMTGRRFSLWFKRIVRVFIQEELMRAKIEQVLGYTDVMDVRDDRVRDGEEEVNEAGDEVERVEKEISPAKVDCLNVVEERVAQMFAENPPEVMQKIREYEAWIWQVKKPSNEEILKCAQIKSGPAIKTVREVLLDAFPPEIED